ncbi:hypothetical protein [Paraburkholderia sp. UCT70]|uniref:hypothetical protein n=1 Tax=Paraburkholderia sp. UCT70 TaxID=2991068 RepID=UPI003D1EDF61
MNVDEFLQSARRPRRLKISAFDAEMRQLRARGVSYQGIADFLSLCNVQISGRAVNRYFERHPYRYGATKPSKARNALQDAPHADVQRSTKRAQPLPQQADPGRRDATPVSRAPDDSVQIVAPKVRTDGVTSATTHADSDRDAVVGGASSEARSDRPSMNRTPHGDVPAGPTGSPPLSDSKGDAEHHAFPQKADIDAPYDSTEVAQAPSLASTIAEKPDIGANPLTDLFKSVDFETPDFFAARMKLRNRQ